MRNSPHSVDLARVLSSKSGHFLRIPPDPGGTQVAFDTAMQPHTILPISLRARLRVHETRLIRWALKQTGGNRSRAADLLQIKRSTLGDRIKRCGLREGSNGEQASQSHF